MIRITTLLLVTALSFVAPADASLQGLPDKASTDRSETRHLVLDNGLRVLLLSDPDLNKSAAALAVHAGSYQDPEDRAGLAHFLEHMLFLGTEKYPDEAEYSNYLRSNGGYSNAYTSGDHTNYLFEINHGAFEGALDRLAQFFIAPLFTAEFTEREMNAVDSEFERNLQSDGWRQQEMFRTLVRDDHPENHFAIGNLGTLQDIERREFIDFYERYYSANLMALAVTSNAGLDQLETWVRQYFSAIENRQQQPVDYSAELVDPERPPGVALMEPVADKRSLSMTFPTPGTRADYRSKSAQLIGFMLGYEGENSLLSHLKEKGLATGLGGYAYEATKDYSLFSITVELTPQGAQAWQDVMQATFAFIDTLRATDYPQYLFEERATMARLDELYRDKGEGAGLATRLARDALHFPLQDAARVGYIWEEPSPDAYFALLDAIRPDNMIATLEAKGVPTDSIEKHFGVQYSYLPFEPALLAALQEPQPVAGVGLPPANPFIPTRVVLLEPRPAKVIDEPGLTLYYAPDTTFERPRVAYRARIRQPERLASLENVVLRDFYVSVIREMLNERTYTALAAGLAVSIDDGREGITMAVSGYSESANAFLSDLLPELRRPELDALLFDALKERKLRAWSNARVGEAWRQAQDIEAKVFRADHYRPEEMLEVGKQVGLEDVQRFARTLYRRGNLEMIAYGNVSQAEAESVAREVVDILGLKPVGNGDVHQSQTLVLEDQDPLVTTEQLVVNNSVYRQLFWLGEATPEHRAAALMLRNFYAEPYYSEMRTRQQLGYIVGSAGFEVEDDLYGLFLIQSADYDAAELKRRSLAFLATLPTLLDELSDEQFETIRAGVHAELTAKDKSIAERANRYFALAFEHEGDWNRDRDTLAALDGLQRDDLARLLARISGEDSRSLTVLALAEQHAPALETIETSFEDVDAWKRKQRYE